METHVAVRRNQIGQVQRLNRIVDVERFQNPLNQILAGEHTGNFRHETLHGFDRQTGVFVLHAFEQRFDLNRSFVHSSETISIRLYFFEGEDIGNFIFALDSIDQIDVVLGEKFVGIARAERIVEDRLFIGFNDLPMGRWSDSGRAARIHSNHFQSQMVAGRIVISQRRSNSSGGHSIITDDKVHAETI